MILPTTIVKQNNYLFRNITRQTFIEFNLDWLSIEFRYQNFYFSSLNSAKRLVQVRVHSFAFSTFEFFKRTFYHHFVEKPVLCIRIHVTFYKRTMFQTESCHPFPQSPGRWVLFFLEAHLRSCFSNKGSKYKFAKILLYQSYKYL